MNEQKPPTHILRIEIPLNMGEPPTDFMGEPPTDFDAVQDAVTLALSISRAAYSGVICDNTMVTLEEA